MPKAKPTTYKQPSRVSGLSIDDILNMDVTQFNALNVKDLKLVTGRLVSAGNKRIRRMKKAGINAPALRSVMESGGVLSIKGKNLNQTRAEFIRAKSFLQSETGSVQKYNRTKKKVKSELKKKGVAITEKQYNDFWRAYNELKDVDPSVNNAQYRYKVMGELAQTMKEQPDIDSTILSMMERLGAIYEQEQERTINNNGGVSSFFEF